MFQVNSTQDMAMGQLQLLQEAKAEIDSVGPSELPTEKVNSGRELLIRRDFGSQELAPIFDHLADWRERMFKATWHRIRQFWTEERWVRVRDDQERKGWRFVGLNRRMTKLQRVQEQLQKGLDIHSALSNVQAMPEAHQLAAAIEQQVQQAQQGQGQPQPGQPQQPQVSPQQVAQLQLQQLAQLPDMREQLTANDVGELDVDIVIDTAPDTAVVEQEEFEKLAQLMEVAAQQGKQLPFEMLITASSLRDKRKLLDILESQSQPDPQAQQLQQQQLQQQMQLMAAQVQALMAEAELQKARAVTEQAKAQKTQVEAQVGVPAEARKDMAIAGRHSAEAVGEMQAVQHKHIQTRGGVFPLPAGGNQ